MSTTIRNQIVAEIEEELSDDDVGLWVIVRSLRDQWSAFEPAEIRLEAAQICRELLSRGASFGQFTGEGDFVQWAPESAIDRVLVEWSDLGRDPTIGEIAWLSLRPAL